MTPTSGLVACRWLIVSWCALAVSAAHGSAAEEPLVADGGAAFREWAPPVYPAALWKERASGFVEVRLIVDGEGRVTSARVIDSTDPRMDEAALETAKKWTFAPAMESGKPVASCLDVAVRFIPERAKAKPGSVLPRADEFPRPVPITPAVPKTKSTDAYPASLRARKLAGLVRFSCTVEPDGSTSRTRITAATHPDFVLPALETFRQWEFEPAMQGDLAVASTISGEVGLDWAAGYPDEVLAANDLTAPDGSPAADAPTIRVIADPVWPFDLFMNNVTGTAEIDFVVGTDGLVASATIGNATHPEFGAAALAAVETWVFGITSRGGRGIQVPLRKTVRFELPDDEEAKAANPALRLRTALQEKLIAGAKGLDAKLQPLYRVAPEYPYALKDDHAPAGSARIELIIDREGRARLPRVVTATHPEFGWAAATAAAQWIFVPPTRGGEPTDVLVQVPFEFAAPQR